MKWNEKKKMKILGSFDDEIYIRLEEERLLDRKTQAGALRNLHLLLRLDQINAKT